MEQCATEVDDDDAQALATNMLDYTTRQITACNLILPLAETTADASSSEGKVCFNWEATTFPWLFPTPCSAFRAPALYAQPERHPSLQFAGKEWLSNSLHRKASHQGMQHPSRVKCNRKSNTTQRQVRPLCARLMWMLWPKNLSAST